MRILVVCTANVCRSPMAAALLERRCADAGVQAEIHSSGTHAGIVEPEPTMIQAMAELGLDLSGHRPRRLDRQQLDGDGRDLVLTMTREHLRTVAVMAPGLIRRTFTAKELARRINGALLVAGGDDASVSGWLAHVGSGRSLADLMGDDPADDVDDPYAMSLARHRRTAEELDGLMTTVAHSLGLWLP